jgi:glutamyl-tRNA reductase
VITAELVASALRQRAAASPGAAAGRPLVLLDLAMPRDVDPDAAGLPGVHLVGLDSLGDGEYRAARESDIAAVRAIVAEEFAGQVSAMHAARVAPTVVALRAKAATVVDAELARLEGRLHTADHGMLNEIERAMRRVVDKLLHAPTVRVKELAGSPGGDSYEDALRVLFDLDPAVVNAVTVADAAPDDAGPAEAGTAEPATGQDET